jgi:hypothetical protein
MNRRRGRFVPRWNSRSSGSDTPRNITDHP